MKKKINELINKIGDVIEKVGVYTISLGLGSCPRLHPLIEWYCGRMLRLIGQHTAPAIQKHS